MALLAAATILSGCLMDGAPVRAQNADPESAKEQLREKLKQAGTFAEAKYNHASWFELRIAMNAARQIADKAGASADELQAATSSLQKEIDTLEERKILPDLSPRIGLSASLFATKRTGPVNNVALMWAATDPQDTFEIHRAPGTSGSFTKIHSGQGTFFNDYGLQAGTYSYKLIAHRDGKTLSSNIEQITTMALPASAQDYSNETGSGAPLGEPLKVKDTFYRFPSEREGKGLKAMWAETSRDGTNWERGAVVMDQSSHPDLSDYKVEAITRFYDEKRDRIVYWAHWEPAAGYGAGRAMVATAKPGERFTVHHIYNPLGIQVRDMSVFRDDDGQGYLVAASNVPGQAANETLYIFKMNADYTDVTGIVTKVMDGRHREAPHIIKTGGFYYLFSSQTAGWYPSQGGYNSAKSLAGPWSDLRYIGNTSTFSAQSGGIIRYGQGKPPVPVMQANRWVRGEGTSGTVMLPLHFAQGFAFTDYSPTLLLDPAKNLVVPLHEGALLSQNQPASSSLPGNKGNEIDKAFDGDYTTFFRSEEKKWPFTVTTDLGAVSKLRNVQISWHIHRGSEAYYKYTIEGSQDGKEWRVLLDRTDDKDTTISKTYGFTSDVLPDAPSARHVRINVQRAVLHNNPNNWYPPTLYEVKVFGEKLN
jgi:hypothetical protein